MTWLWAKNILHGELNVQLKHLADEAQRTLPRSLERQRALDNLVRAILTSGQLWYPQQFQYYEEVYEEALQNLWLYICQEIEQYNPEIGEVLAWVNMLLRRRFFQEVLAKMRNQHIKFIPDVSYLLSNYALPEEPPLPTQLLKEYIQSDPEEIFRREHVENHPEANFQALVHRRNAGQMWKDISTELGVNSSTLINFYQRCIVKFRPKFKEYLH